MAQERIHGRIGAVPLREQEALSRLVGESGSFRAVVGLLPTVARTQATVMISGETGTGKELVARAVHYLGPRAAQPFVPVNCGALPDTLLERELFGHERGAFTDARERRIGLIAQAQHGTLFLDEVDSLSPRAQVVLLRVLQDGVYRSLGGATELSADVRVVVATNTSLPDLVAQGRFRADLYYRLNVIPLKLPPLRERHDDIVPLARHFLQKHRGEAAPCVLTADAERVLLAYAWPGNVRELENVVQRALAMHAGTSITAVALDLPPAPSLPSQVASAAPVPTVPDAALPPFNEAKRAVLQAFERDYVMRMLRVHHGNVSRAAQSACKERRDFGRLMKKYQLKAREAS